MATHFMRILSRMMVPGPARTPSRPDVRAAAAVRGQLQPHWVHQSPPSHTQDCYPALQGDNLPLSALGVGGMGEVA